jgi:hypothetical protein
MEYLLLLHDDETRWGRMSEEDLGRGMGAYAAYTNALQEAGVFVGGNPLAATTTATIVRVTSDGKTSVLDGPYAETKEQLGGYYLIDVPDLDAAISWAARCPCASSGTVEVRPIAQIPTPAQ